MNQQTGKRGVCWRFCAGLALVWSVALSAVQAADLHVPIPYISVQAAIDAANPGDTVYLQPGIYRENINVNGKNITIRAFNTHFDTVLDGGASGPVVTFSGRETDKCVLRDLIIFNGSAANGGGILGNNTMATVRNCTITSNSATGKGGGVYAFDGSLRKTTIIQNAAGSGGGIADSDGTIDECVITKNRASATGGGTYNCNGLIQFSQITKNEADTAGGGVDKADGFLLANVIDGNMVLKVGPTGSPASFGGGIANATGYVVANTITNNYAAGDGGGVAKSDGILQNNVIARNSARRGAGMASCDGRVENCTIWGNNALSQGGGVFDMGTQVSNSIIYANSAPVDAQWAGVNVPTFSCVQGWMGGQPDILTGDPMLENPAKGNFHLLPWSPCVDAGRFIPDLNFDFEGDFRPHMTVTDFRGDGSGFDIGADEFVPAHIDLAVGFLKANVKYKGAIPKLKGNVQGTVLVVNNGTDTISGPIYVQFYGSGDPIWSPDDLPVGKLFKIKSLKPGQSKKLTCKVKLPPNTPVTGLYFLSVADPGYAVGDVDRSNNVAVYGPLP